MASLVDTNILVYSFDAPDPVKQRLADEILRNGLFDDGIVLAHQCIVEFVAAVSRPREELGRAPLLPLAEARLEAEELLAEYAMLYPTREVVLTALRGKATYGLSWFDAHLWAHAEVYGVEEILSEDFTHGRHYGGVRAEPVHERRRSARAPAPLHLGADGREVRGAAGRRGCAPRPATLHAHAALT